MLAIAKGDHSTLHVLADGQLSTDDYVDFVTRIEWFLAGQDGPVDMLIELGPDFGGWNLDTLFRDKTFSLTAAGSIRRIAIVGDQRWEDWATGALYAKLAADIRFFLTTSKLDASHWLSSPFAERTA